MAVLMVLVWIVIIDANGAAATPGLRSLDLLVVQQHIYTVM